MSACFVSFGALAGKALGAEPGSSSVPSGPIDAATTLGELVAHPAFNGGGLLLLPWYGRREDLEAPFSEVGSLHESMPHAQVLSEHGYNAFSLSYRAGSGDMAAEGVAHAVAYICEHADELGVSTEGYSLWGGSAGARMASAVGTYGTAAFGAPEAPRAATVVMAYTGQSTYTEFDPPTYAVVGENDGIAPARVSYQAFVVDYRLRPFTQQEGALDLARAVRFVRAHASDYGIEPGAVAVMGFSAGGILAGEMLLHYAGSVTPDALDPAYVPDALDGVSADAAACGMICSFYGRLSVASDDVEEFASAGLPPTCFCYGTRDPFVDQFELCAEALAEAGVEVDELVLPGVGHGYGALGGWIPTYDAWLSEVLARA